MPVWPDAMLARQARCLVQYLEELPGDEATLAGNICGCNTGPSRLDGHLASKSDDNRTGWAAGKRMHVKHS